MISADVTKSVLATLGQALPEQADDLIVSVEIRNGWGNAIYVRVHSPLPRTAANQYLWARLRSAIEDVLEDCRHRVEIVWNSSG